MTYHAIIVFGKGKTDPCLTNIYSDKKDADHVVDKLNTNLPIDMYARVYAGTKESIKTIIPFMLNADDWANWN